MAFLVVREPGRSAAAIRIDGAIRIGRDPAAELALADRQVSRLHAALACDGGAWTVTDLGSRHGMRVNGAPCARHRLADGDRIQLGGSLLVFHAGAAPPVVLDTRTTDAAPPPAVLDVAADGTDRVRRAEPPRAADVELAGDSEPMRRLRADLARFALADTAIHLHGETGTGKELAARALHAASPRAAAPLEVLNCAAIPDAMIESELFGHVRGAFTGAARDRRGRFAMAHRGTLFLDEVAELSPAAQAKLLRVLEDGEVQPLGAERPLRVDVRVISATHKDLAAEVAAGRFRGDLYWRLAVVELALPPLRARASDIALLSDRFLARAAARLGRPLTGFTAAARALLAAHAWPGNVRELAHEIERAAIVADGPRVDAPDLRLRSSSSSSSLPLPPPPPAPPSPPLAERFAGLDQLERDLVAESLQAARGNVTEAARLLGISRIMMRRRLERFALSPDRDR